VPTYIGWGTAIGAGTVTTQVAGTITSLSSQSIGESFLVFSSTKPAAYTVNSNITAGAGSATTTTSGATVGGYYQLNNEVILVGTVTSNTVLTISRGQNGSTAGTAKTNDLMTNGNPPGYGTANPNHADMFAHAGFQALALNTGDSIQFTWQINVTS
jgi:hypothetical protein